MAPSIHVNLLGPCELLVGRCPVEATVRHYLLLGLFLLRDVTTCSRHELATLLWPRVSESQARHSLSQALYTLHVGTGGVKIFQGNSTQLSIRTITSDVAAFEQAVQQADWQAAAKLFRGQLYDHASLPVHGAVLELFDHHRLRLAQLALRVVEGLYLDGQSRAAAMLDARIPSTAARPDIGDALESGRWAQIPDHLSESLTGAVSRSNIHSIFVGRQRELSVLEEAFVRATHKGFAAIAIEGEPGIGKSALANRFARIRALRGSTVLVAKAFSAEQNLPYGVVAQWLREVGSSTLAHIEEPWLEIIRNAFPDATEEILSIHPPTAALGVESPSEYRVLEAIRRVLTQLSQTAPVLLLLDDAQFADAASLGFVHYFARRSSGAPVLFAATVRAPGSAPTAPFAGWEGAERLRVEPLSKADISHLLRKLHGEGEVRGEHRVDNLLAQTGGNPLLVASLLVAERDGDPNGVPDSVVEFFLPRLKALSEDAALLLASIAVTGVTPKFETSAKIAGFPHSPLRAAAALQELEAAALVIVEDDGCVRTRHGIVAEVAVASLGAAERRVLYGRAARVLTEAGSSHPSVVAVQHDIAGDRLDAFATALKAAAASRDLHATREREFFLKMALSNAPDSDSEVQIRIELADLFRHLGRPSEGMEVVAEDAILNASPVAQSQARASRLAIQLRRVDAAKDVAQVWQEIESLAEHLDPETVAELYYCLAAAAHDLGRTGDTVTAAEKALALAEALPVSPHGALVASRSAMVLALYLGFEEGLNVIDRLFPAVRSSLEGYAQCLWARGTVLIAAGRLLEAEEALLCGIELMERCCLYGSLFALHNKLGVCYMEQGRFRESAQQLGEAARVGREFMGPSRAAVAADNLAMLHLESGQYELALRTARENGSAPSANSSRELFHRQGIIGLCSLELGLLAQAFEAKREIDLLFDQHEYWSNDVSYVETFLARMLVLEDRVAAARSRLETAIEIYRPRDLMCRSRLELELARIDLKRDPRAALARADGMLEVLRGTGARPLIDRFEEIADRARLQPA
jgi:tetratricopeptide (TPR) repeat protein